MYFNHPWPGLQYGKGRLSIYKPYAIYRVSQYSFLFVTVFSDRRFCSKML